MIKRGYAIQMTYDISDIEKQEAKKALLHFDNAVKLLGFASDNLNTIKTPFTDNSDMTPESVVKERFFLRQFRDQSIEQFDAFKFSAFKCVSIMQNFSSDTQTIKLMKSFISAIDDLETKVNDFVKSFDVLDSKDFSKKIVEKINDIQKQCDDIHEIVDERIKDHIQKNILANNWVDIVSNNLQNKIEKKTPLMLELFNKRQDQLNEELKNK
jgi:hypothetical protein